ncbi:enoyl-CoA hydratase-related protein [Polaromonas sp.]|uniref:enoyl-CoA hydratase/isomerase family protein n=1 Tax=Polaromonas sp. TaxID=1869339 RepID=UPI0018143144|nr:enoyl-CoA hydratase-related protein [Polaromonas sp.]NML84108.1 enoyl-CoA hydratase [Polaromonas sp.]
MTVQFNAVLDQHILRLSFGTAGRRNVMSDAWFAALEDHLRQAQGNPVVRVVLLSGQGDAFCAGADLKGLATELFPEGYARSALARLLERLADFDKPLVAAVHGAAIGGGSTLLLHCDFVFAAEGTLFQLPFARLGLVPEFGASYLLPLHAGVRLARELVLLAAPFDAHTAKRAGIVSEVVMPQALMAHAQTTAVALAALPPGPLRAAKRLLQAGHRAALAAAFAAEGKALDAAVASPELHEAVDAFLSKRTPDFSRFS